MGETSGIMLNYLFALAVLLPLANGNSTNSNYPPFAACDPNLITRIKASWGLTGAPHTTLDLAKPGECYFVAHTSFVHMDSGVKCVSMEMTNTSMNIAFLSKDNDPNVWLNYTIEHTEGGTILGAPTDKTVSDGSKSFKWYTVFKGNGIVINYVCSESKDSVGPPLTVFWVTKRSYDTEFTKTAIDRSYTFLKSLGFHFTNSYVDQCFSPDPDQSEGISRDAETTSAKATSAASG